MLRRASELRASKLWGISSISLTKVGGKIMQCIYGEFSCFFSSPSVLCFRIRAWDKFASVGFIVSYIFSLPTVPVLLRCDSLLFFFSRFLLKNLFLLPPVFLVFTDTSRQILIPLVMKFFESSLEVEDSCLPLVVKQIGKFTFGLEKHLTLKNKIWFLNLFCRYVVRT